MYTSGHLPLLICTHLVAASLVCSLWNFHTHTHTHSPSPSQSHVQCCRHPVSSTGGNKRRRGRGGGGGGGGGGGRRDRSGHGRGACRAGSLLGRLSSLARPQGVAAGGGSINAVDGGSVERLRTSSPSLRLTLCLRSRVCCVVLYLLPT